MFKALYLCIVLSVLFCATSTSALLNSEPTQLESTNATDYSLGSFYRIHFKSCDGKLSSPHFKVLNIYSSHRQVVKIDEDWTLIVKGLFSESFPRNNPGRVQVLADAIQPIGWTYTEPKYYEPCKNKGNKCLLADKVQTMKFTVQAKVHSLQADARRVRIKVSDVGDNGKETKWSCTEFLMHFRW
eukprot:Nk52_evm2s249 gene=Nk52_evmTU2s249